MNTLLKRTNKTEVCLKDDTKFSSVQSLSPVQLFVTPWTSARWASLSITNSRSPSKPMSIESVMPSNHLILCCPLLLQPSVFPSIRVFSNESVLRIRWPKYWSFSFNISPSNEHPELISFRTGWIYLQSKGFSSSLIQEKSSKASILLCSTFFRRRQWHPTPGILPGKSHGQRSLVGCGPWGCEESDATEWLHFHFSLLCIGERNGNPLQCSCLENPRDGGTWWAAVYGVAQGQTRLKRLSSSSSSP